MSGVASTFQPATRPPRRLRVRIPRAKPARRKISILLVSHQPPLREGLRVMLRPCRRLAVVGEAASGRDALALVDRLHAAVILFHLRPPQRDGLRIIARIKQQHPAGAVLVLSDLADEELVLEAARAGAAGYLANTPSRELICSAVTAVASGAMLFSAALFREAIGSPSAPRFAPAPSPRLAAPAKGLSAREQAILRMLAEGHTNREIASSLAIAEVTVKKHIRSLVDKLHAADRTNAAVIAMRLGLIS